MLQWADVLSINYHSMISIQLIHARLCGELSTLAHLFGHSNFIISSHYLASPRTNILLLTPSLNLRRIESISGIMNVNKKLGRFKQWAGERMGQEAKTSVSDEFKSLEVEMTLRHEGSITSQAVMMRSARMLMYSRYGQAPEVDDRLCKDLIET